MIMARVRTGGTRKGWGGWTRKNDDERKEVSARGKREGGGIRGCMPMRISGRRV